MAESSNSDNDGNFDVTTDASEDADFSVNLRLPKFSNDCVDIDFLDALGTKINKDEIKYLGKLRYSNEWQVTLKSKEARDKLLEVGSFIVKRKKCIIHPCGRQVVGRIHWLPIDVSEDIIKDILQHFGEISKFGCEKLFPDRDSSPHSLIRFFILTLNNDCSREDIPHFISVNKHQGLVAIKGRDPMCLECRQIGHRKVNCPVIEKRRIERASQNLKKSKNVKTPKKNIKIEPNVDEQSSSSKNKDVKHSAVTTPSSSEISENVNLVQDSKENIHTMASDVKRLQHLVSVFSQRMNEVLASSSLSASNSNSIQSTIEPLQSAASAMSILDDRRSKKKKKKKPKTSDNYDLVAAEVNNDTSSSGQHSPKGSLDSGIALNENSTSSSSGHSNNNENNLSKELLKTNANIPAVSNCGNADNVVQKKKKNKKKKSGSTIPGLTHP